MWGGVGSSIEAFGIRQRLSPFCLLIAVGAVACGSAAPEYRVLFGSEPSALSAEEMAEIFGALAERFPASEDAVFADALCGDINPEIELADLNHDGHPETFVHWGNSCTSGMTGRSITMFSRDRNGSLFEQFGFPAFGFTQLPQETQGYSDLQFGGPGFCFGVWAFRGERYEFECNMPQETGGCNGRESICPTQQ
jgi:hypothetical protein